MRKLTLDERVAPSIFGVRDRNLILLQERLGVRLSSRGKELFIEGDESSELAAERLLTKFSDLLDQGYSPKEGDIDLALNLLKEDETLELKDFFAGVPLHPWAKKQISPRSMNQRRYLAAIERHDIVFGIGPAGTGKTYLAMAMAITALLNKFVHRIILTRPAIEAGEKLGFLPGDMFQKVDPYLRPLYDALYDLLDTEKANSLLERGSIEVAPLAYMRGRTLNDSFIILDEAQNTTTEQMKMFLTRIGFDSKAVITGDLTQTDLPQGRTSGLVDARDLLMATPGIEFVFFEKKDVVRHPLVQLIIKAYEDRENRKAE
ncbi:MAG: PhoH family protein [Acidobacteriota bacterium]